MRTITNILLEISVTSSILILVVLIIRKLFKNKISATIQYSVWLVVVLRLLMPFSIPSSVSVMNMFGFNKPQTTAIQTANITPTDKPAVEIETILNYDVNRSFSENVNNIQPET